MHDFTYLTKIPSVENHMQTDFSTEKKYSSYILKKFVLL